MAQQFEVQALGLNGIPYRIEIYNSNYGGTTVTQLDGDQQFIRFEGGQRERVGIEPIWGKEVRINVRTNEDLSPLFGLEDRDAEVRVFRTDTSSLVWKGFILTDFFQDEPLTDLPGVELRAVDGLTTLEGDSFDALSGVSDSDIGEEGFISYTDLFTGVLSTLYDSPLDVEFAVEWYPDAGGQLTSSDNPLRYSGARPDVYYDSEDGEWFDQQSALEDALKSQGLEVRQAVIGGALTWLLAQPTALSSGSVKTWRYAPGGTEDTSSPFTRDLSLDLSSADTNRPTREFERRSESVSVTHDHTPIENLVGDDGYEEIGKGNASGWQIDNAATSYIDASILNHDNADASSVGAPDPTPSSLQQDTYVLEVRGSSQNNAVEYPISQDLGDISGIPPETALKFFHQLWHEPFEQQPSNGDQPHLYAELEIGGFYLKEFEAGVRQSVKGGSGTLPVQSLDRAIPNGTKLPLYNRTDSPPDQIPRAFITLSERADKGDTVLVGDISREVDSKWSVAYLGFTSTAYDFALWRWTKNPNSWGRVEARAFAKDPNGQPLSGNATLRIGGAALYGETNAGNVVDRPAFVDDVTLQLTQQGNELTATTKEGSVSENGKSRDLSVLLSSGPTSLNARRIKGVGPSSDYEPTNWGIGVGGGSLSLAGLQARERLRYLREHLERQQLTVYARNKSPVVTGEEIVQFDGKTWRVAEFSSDPYNGEIGLTLIQHADAGTTNLSIETVRDTDGGGTSGGGGATPAVGGGGGGGGDAIEVIQLDASSGSVTETLPSPDQGAALVVSRIDDSSNTATVETADTASQEIRFPQGKDASSVDLRPEQSLLITADGTHWHVEEGQGLRAEAEDVTSDGGTKDSPSLTQTATYDSDGTTSVTSSDVSIERYVRTDNSGNATLVYESGGTEIARLSSGGRFETRKDQEAFMDGSLNSGQGTNSLLQVEDGQGDVLTTDAASIDFTGSGVNVSVNGDDVTVDVSGGSGSDIDIEDNQSVVVGGATGLSFEGSGIDSVDNDGDGTATVNISKGSSIEVQERGTAQVSDVTVLDFIGSDFNVDNPTSGEAEVSLGNVDADTLDGVEGSNYARTDVNETFENQVGFSGSDDLTSNPSASPSNTGWKVGLNGSEYWMGVGAFTFAIRSGDWISLFPGGVLPANDSSGLNDLDSNAEVGFGANRNIIKKNTGFGGEAAPSYPLDVNGDINASGVGRFDITGDADTLDGVEGSNYARTDVNETFENQVGFSGSDDLTSNPSASPSDTGWKVGLNGSEYWLGVGSFTLAIRSGGWVSLFPGGALPADDSTGSNDLDSNAEVGFGANKNVVKQNTGFGGETAPSYPLDVNGDINASGVGRFDITGDAESVDGLDGFQIARTDTSEIFTDQVRIDGPLAGSDNEIGNNDDFVLALGGKPYGVDDTDNTGDNRLGDGLLQTAHGKASDYRTYLQGGHGRVAHTWNAYFDGSIWRSVVGNEPHSLVGIGNGQPGGTTGGGVTLATADAVNTANADNEQDAEDPVDWNVGLHVDVDGSVIVQGTDSSSGYTLNVDGSGDLVITTPTGNKAKFLSNGDIEAFA